MSQSTNWLYLVMHVETWDSLGVSHPAKGSLGVVPVFRSEKEAEAYCNGENYQIFKVQGGGW